MIALSELVERAWRNRTLPERLNEWAKEQPDKPFFRCSETWTTYGEARERSLRVAAGLQHLGLQKGDRVALISQNTDEAILCLLALAQLGAIAVPLNIFLKGEFLKYQLTDCEASALLTDSDGLQSFAAIEDTLPNIKTIGLIDSDTIPEFQIKDRTIVTFKHLFEATQELSAPIIKRADPICIFYSSGTTGLSKGCVCSHGYFLAASIPKLECGWFGHDDVLYTPFPLFHTAGYSLFLGGALQAGASICFDRAFSASRFISRVKDVGATTAHGVGPMAMAILATAESATDSENTLRQCTWSPLPVAQQLEFERRFGVDVISAGYGQTEASPIAIVGFKDSKHRRDVLGRPANHMHVMIVDENDDPVPVGELGEIVVRPKRPDAIFQGYWGKPEEFIESRRNLWHHTGDIGRIDEEGFLHFSDRKKDMIRRRGENISSFELEAAIRNHPSVENVAAFAVPADIGDDDVKVCITFTAGADPTPQDLFDFFAKHIPYFAIPRYIECMDVLPVNANGRVMKHILRDAGITKNDWDFEALGLSLDKQDRRAS